MLLWYLCGEYVCLKFVFFSTWHSLRLLSLVLVFQRVFVVFRVSDFIITYVVSSYKLLILFTQMVAHIRSWICKFVLLSKYCKACFQRKRNKKSTDECNDDLATVYAISCFDYCLKLYSLFSILINIYSISIIILHEMKW